MAAAAWYDETLPEQNAPVNERGEETQRLRAFPNEDICLWMPHIDNSRVARKSDPKQAGAMYSSFTKASVIVLFAVGLLFPSAHGMLAGYQLHKLEREQQALMEQRRVLEVEEGKLLSPSRLRELAEAQNFVDPAPANIHYLESKSDGSFALRKKENLPGSTKE